MRSNRSFVYSLMDSIQTLLLTYAGRVCDNEDSCVRRPHQKSEAPQLFYNKTPHKHNNIFSINNTNSIQIYYHNKFTFHNTILLQQTQQKRLYRPSHFDTISLFLKHYIIYLQLSTTFSTSSLILNNHPSFTKSP